ncbi:MAG: hypothetical protein V1760_03520, partial [Candidatus Peregrinibacteria bacterium]
LDRRVFYTLWDSDIWRQGGYEAVNQQINQETTARQFASRPSIPPETEAGDIIAQGMEENIACSMLRIIVEQLLTANPENPPPQELIENMSKVCGYDKIKENLKTPTAAPPMSWRRTMNPALMMPWKT